MIEYEIRPADESESAQIKDLIHLVGINPSSLNWSRFIVAVKADGEIIGCGQIKPHGQDVKEMASIAVKPEHRKQGIARKIIEELLRISPRPLYLMCISHNGPMYEKFGFHAIELDEMPRYFKRMRKLFDAVSVVRKMDESLLVMKLE